MNRALLDFLLFDWLRAHALTQRERHVDHSRETFESVLDLSERLARDKFAPFIRLVRRSDCLPLRPCQPRSEHLDNRFVYPALERLE